MKLKDTKKLGNPGIENGGFQRIYEHKIKQASKYNISLDDGAVNLFGIGTGWLSRILTLP